MNKTKESILEVLCGIKHPAQIMNLFPEENKISATARIYKSIDEFDKMEDTEENVNRLVNQIYTLCKN